LSRYTFSNLPASATMRRVYEICSLKFFVTFFMQAALRLKDLCNVRHRPSRRERLILTTATRGRHSNVMLFADIINVSACDNRDNYNKNVCFSCLSCLCNICVYIFMSCSFMPCYFIRLFHVLQFHVQHFQRPLLTVA